MADKQSSEDKINLIKGIYNKALTEIGKIKEERDKKIQELMKEVDAKQISEILKDIKNAK